MKKSTLSILLVFLSGEVYPSEKAVKRIERSTTTCSFYLTKLDQQDIISSKEVILRKPQNTPRKIVAFEEQDIAVFHGTEKLQNLLENPGQERMNHRVQYFSFDPTNQFRKLSESSNYVITDLGLSKISATMVQGDYTVTMSCEDGKMKSVEHGSGEEKFACSFTRYSFENQRIVDRVFAPSSMRPTEIHGKEFYGFGLADEQQLDIELSNTLYHGTAPTVAVTGDDVQFVKIKSSARVTRRTKPAFPALQLSGECLKIDGELPVLAKRFRKKEINIRMNDGKVVHEVPIPSVPGYKPYRVQLEPSFAQDQGGKSIMVQTKLQERSDSGEIWHGIFQLTSTGSVAHTITENINQEAIDSSRFPVFLYRCHDSDVPISNECEIDASWVEEGKKEWIKPVIFYRKNN